MVNVLHLILYTKTVYLWMSDKKECLTYRKSTWTITVCVWIWKISSIFNIIKKLLKKKIISMTQRHKLSHYIPLSHSKFARYNKQYKCILLLFSKMSSDQLLSQEYFKRKFCFSFWRQWFIWFMLLFFRLMIIYTMKYYKIKLYEFWLFKKLT